MSDNPPPQFAAYPRARLLQYGTTKKLQALADGYFGLNYVFAAYIVSILIGSVLSSAVSRTLVYVFYLVMLIVLIGYSGIMIQKIGLGKGWSRWGTIFARVLMAINFFGCGILGFVVFQQIAAREMTRYGIKMGFFGVKKRDIVAALNQIRQTESGGVVPSVEGVP